MPRISEQKPCLVMKEIWEKTQNLLRIPFQWLICLNNNNNKIFWLCRVFNVLLLFDPSRSNCLVKWKSHHLLTLLLVFQKRCFTKMHRISISTETVTLLDLTVHRGKYLSPQWCFSSWLVHPMHSTGWQTTELTDVWLMSVLCACPTFML